MWPQEEGPQEKEGCPVPQEGVRGETYGGARRKDVRFHTGGGRMSRFNRGEGGKHITLCLKHCIQTEPCGGRGLPGPETQRLDGRFSAQTPDSPYPCGPQPTVALARAQSFQV